MYSFSKKLKLSAIIFMITGVLGIAYGFYSAPSTIADVQEIMMHQENAHGEAQVSNTNEHIENGEEANKEHNDESEHLTHMLHSLQNRPYSAVFIAMFFFFMIALGTLVFYAIQYASQAGWSIVLFRVMEGITAYLLPGSLFILAFLIISAANGHHYYVWMTPDFYNPQSEHYDEILVGKSWWLNTPFWMIRTFIYLLGWNFYRYFAVKKSLAQDSAKDLTYYKKSMKASIYFLIFFFVTESMMSWDWIMSLTPHWQSSLFGWYVFSSMFVSAITVIAMVTIYLRSRGFLPKVNDSHLHDLAKFMFGFSIFWTYLWFSQFMLIWYANMPEETAYFVPRLLGNYQLLFIGMLLPNFVFPILVLMNSDYKRVPWFIISTGIIILIGHYVDIFVMITPATVGDQWNIGIPEIGSILFFLGLFIYVVFTALTKSPLLVKGNPFLKESEHFRY
ncbi:quinol:cytochrome C oxidoreductase [Lutibacter sp.]|uniref:quinol:cytochrome C oxidoreductase n=1 Tax=Lutibacter sp. TaxID=1925666 RepID=UPI0025C4F449|nr:quinol:cytochrome C oxidoreductase [Lutibacter sp.]MCF6168835.1 quinol:cytochrome C oxidoreductase [Lutibacter sp.]